MLLAVCYIGCVWFIEACLLLGDWMIIRKKSDYVLYMTIRGEQRKDADVVRIVKEYKAALWKFAVLLFAASAGFLAFGGYASYHIWYLTVWTTGAILGDYRMIKKYTGKMYRLKQEKGWCEPSKQTECNVDTAVSRMKKTLPVSELWMFLPVWLCLASFFWWFLYGTEYMFLLSFPVMNVPVLVLCFWLFHHVSHSKLKVYSEDTDINYALNRAAKRAWTGCIVAEAVLLCAYHFFLMLWMHSYMKDIAEDGEVFNGWRFWGIFICVSFLVTLLFAGILWRAAARVKRAKKELAAGQEEYWKEDVDACWKNGYYYNPQDSNTFVENRCYGITTNMATVWGKITKWVLICTFLLCVLIGAAMLPLDFGTITMKQKENGIELRGALYYNELIAFDEVKKVTLLEETPELSRIFGSGMKQMALGDYHFKGYGSGKAMVWRKADYFILVEKMNGKLLLFSVEDAQEMLRCYETLKRYEQEEKVE